MILQFTAWPEMISFPYFINQGFVTYKDMVHVYPPLLINVLAILYKVFGFNIWTLKIFSWSTFLLNDILLFILIKKITSKEKIALFILFIYTVLQPILEGNMMWPDLFLIPFLLLGLLFILNKKYFLTGVALSFALMTKQTGAFYLFITFLFLILTKEKTKNIGKFIVGGLVVGLPFIINLISQNSFQDFLNWVIIYPSKYWTKFPGYVQLSPSLRENIILFILFLPLAYLLFTAKKKIFQDNFFLLIFSFMIAAIIGIYPRFSFFHFQPVLVFIMIILGVLLSKNLKISYRLLLFMPLTILILTFRSLQFGTTRFWSQNDLVLSQIIKSDSQVNKPIYLLNLPSQHYAFSDRVPNKPWIDNFGWYLEIPGVQEKVIKSLTENPPSAIFWPTPQQGNWFDLGVYLPKKITNWIERNYNRKAEVQKGIWEWIPKNQK